MILLIDNYDSFTWNLVQRLGEIDPSLEPGRNLLVIRNDKIEPEAIETINNGSAPDQILISPGPCTPAQAGISGDVIERFAGRVPILGVCLGHQCIGDRYGMTVARHEILMHGKTSPVHHDGKGIFDGLTDPFTATRYHSLVVLADSVPPAPAAGQEGGEVSAWTDEVDGNGGTRRVVMGLRRVWADSGKAALDGVQFHPESFLTDEGPRLLENFLGRGEAPGTRH